MLPSSPDLSPTASVGLDAVHSSSVNLSSRIPVGTGTELAGFIVTIGAAFGPDARYLLSPEYLASPMPDAVWRLLRPDGTAAAVGRVDLGQRANPLSRSLRRYHRAALNEAVAIHVTQEDMGGVWEASELRWAFIEHDDPVHTTPRNRESADILDSFDGEVERLTAEVALVVTEDIVPQLPDELVEGAVANQEVNEMNKPETIEDLRAALATVNAELTEARQTIQRLQEAAQHEPAHHIPAHPADCRATAQRLNAQV